MLDYKMQKNSKANMFDMFIDEMKMSYQEAKETMENLIKEKSIEEISETTNDIFIDFVNDVVKVSFLSDEGEVLLEKRCQNNSGFKPSFFEILEIEKVRKKTFFNFYLSEKLEELFEMKKLKRILKYEYGKYLKNFSAFDLFLSVDVRAFDN